MGGINAQLGSECLGGITCIHFYYSEFKLVLMLQTRRQRHSKEQRHGGYCLEEKYCYLTAVLDTS